MLAGGFVFLASPHVHDELCRFATISKCSAVLQIMTKMKRTHEMN